MDTDIKIFWIDLFSGAGGTTTGIHLSEANATVVACVNHDKKAIQSHKINHPNCLHFIEDVRDFKVVLKLKKLVDNLRKKHADCFINIWASLECTNYSKAKGGLPRDADSRTLANHLFMYLEMLCPNYLYIENVREFLSWGPLDKNGRPISLKNGIDFIKWKENIQKYGYKYDHKILNAADFGAYTKRERLFIIFAKLNLPIKFPEPTHYNPKKLKQQKNSLFQFNKKPWLAVKDVLELEKEGNSIFTRKKPLVENTLKRIYAGLIKFVAGGEKQFIKRYNGGNLTEKSKSLNEPIGSISTNNRHAVVSTNFLKKYYSGRPSGKVISIEGPAGAITTIDGHALVQTKFLTDYYGNGKSHSIYSPCPTVPTKDKFAYIMMNYSNSDAASVDHPAWSITQNPKHNLVTTKSWLLNPQYSNKGSSIDDPCFTIIARTDKMPPYLLTTKKGNYGIVVFKNDSETMIKIKEFMVLYGIIDIKMRMLFIDELKRIQGFPKDYELIGTKTDQKKQIGNAVEVNQAKALITANSEALYNLKILT